MFEKFLNRVEPKDVGGVHQSTPFTGTASTQSNHENVRTVGRKRSKSRSSNMDRSLRLTAEQKCDIAQREIEELREEIDTLKEDSEKVLDTYKVRTIPCMQLFIRDMLKIGPILVHNYYLSLIEQRFCWRC